MLRMPRGGPARGAWPHGSLLLRRRLPHEALDAVLAGVVLEPLPGLLGQLLEVLRLLPAVLLGQAQAEEQALRRELEAEHLVVARPVGVGQRQQDELAAGGIDRLGLRLAGRR